MVSHCSGKLFMHMTSLKIKLQIFTSHYECLPIIVGRGSRTVYIFYDREREISLPDCTIIRSGVSTWAVWWSHKASLRCCHSLLHRTQILDAFAACLCMMKMEPRTSFLKKFYIYLMGCYLQGTTLLGVSAGLQEKVSCFFPFSCCVCTVLRKRETDKRCMLVLGD
jgi:hypothetical protein